MLCFNRIRPRKGVHNFQKRVNSFFSLREEGQTKKSWIQKLYLGLRKVFYTLWRREKRSTPIDRKGEKVNMPPGQNSTLWLWGVVKDNLQKNKFCRDWLSQTNIARKMNSPHECKKLSFPPLFLLRSLRYGWILEACTFYVKKDKIWGFNSCRSPRCVLLCACIETQFSRQACSSHHQIVIWICFVGTSISINSEMAMLSSF